MTPEDRQTFCEEFVQASADWKRLQEHPEGETALERLFRTVSATELRLILLGVSACAGTLLLIFFMAFAYERSVLMSVLAFVTGFVLTFCLGGRLLKGPLQKKRDKALRQALEAKFPPTGSDLFNRFLDNKTSPYVALLQERATFRDHVFLAAFVRRTLPLLEEMRTRHASVFSSADTALLLRLGRSPLLCPVKEELEAFFALLNRLGEELPDRGREPGLSARQIALFRELGEVDWVAELDAIVAYDRECSEADAACAQSA